MSMLTAAILFAAGLALVLFFSEKLVEGTVGSSLHFGLSAFLISIIFIGFDPENLAVGAVASWEGASGIALGSIMGAAMVAVALAFGFTALVAPMEFESAPGPVLAVPVAAVLLPGLLGWDGQLSRVDGALLLAAYAGGVGWLLRMGRRGLEIRAGGEMAEVFEKERPPGRGKSLALLAGSLVAITAGSELLVRSSERLVGGFGLSETVFGMTLLALLVSVEEVARELPAALKGRPDISVGNVLGSVLAFFLFNAGAIALVRPLPVSTEILAFYWPFCVAAVLIVTFCMWRRRVSRPAGALLLALYACFFAGAWLI
ncbi:MAG: sodium:calcium antiporter [Balneolaceae bacterium]|nr:sodium:calcium antiporter [Balneolaceae bacterium]